ncbi:hypothetical protein EFV37_13180 [Mesorhizobium loti]|uniref:Prohead serine protease domain-containing protein n=1 Tax=Mesorhizobium jarvisii TaxID=1777867 RepID=A0A6M7TI39_9HYPH|nr:MULTISPECIES: HK97 family phage prohead protease [Mesorhizobium]OBQ58035.1 hypothetical protein A9K72_27920 [Mesorhizobium loti]QKC63147.1 hypothetical protein EB229_13170 [Mesorhizobium jarvisii]QKD09058.1 hypothetical protein EFV37_13180 [Mesorhizobium loti]RJT30154.1 hypothetical protein D3242_25905 [Mesorhizobium jarvisii]
MTEIRRSASPAILKFVGDGIGVRQVRAIVSTGELDRMGDIIDQAGIKLDAFRRSPTVLWQHDSDHPIAKALSVSMEGGKLVALVQFPDVGVSAKSDEVYGLIKAGIINSTSIGFMPLKSVPIDPSKPYGGLRFISCELLEFSFVSVAANAGALITGRSVSKTPRLDAARRSLAEISRK